MGSLDVMVDIETTGTDPAHSGILQIAAVAFRLSDRWVSPTFFNRSLRVPAGRFWDEGTRGFWSKHREVLARITREAHEPREVMQELQTWACHHAEGAEIRLWGKPISFEAPFLESYFRQYEIQNPFGFRSVRDLRTHLEAKLGRCPIDWEKQHPMVGDAHDALQDALHQVKLLFLA